MGCEVHNLSNKSVSWLRERDRHILTVDRETFISDRRFVALHTRSQISDMVTLSIHSVEMRDAGKYQCQVSAQNKISRSVELIVVRPQVKNTLKCFATPTGTRNEKLEIKLVRSLKSNLQCKGSRLLSCLFLFP